MSWRRWSYAVWGYSLWIPRQNGRMEQGFTQFHGKTLLSLLPGPICQYPSDLVGLAHRIPRWSLFSSKVGCWGYSLWIPRRKCRMKQGITQFHSKTLPSLLLGSYLPIPLRFGWVGTQNTPLELGLLESWLLRVSNEIPRQKCRIKQGITQFHGKTLPSLLLGSYLPIPCRFGWVST